MSAEVSNENSDKLAELEGDLARLLQERRRILWQFAIVSIPFFAVVAYTVFYCIKAIGRGDWSYVYQYGGGLVGSVVLGFSGAAVIDYMGRKIGRGKAGGLGTQAHPRIFFILDLFSFLLPRRIRRACWEPSHWEMKADYLGACSVHSTTARRAILWFTFLLKSVVVWCQCWWSFLPAPFRFSAIVIVSIFVLDSLASLLGYGSAIDVLSKISPYLGG